MSIKCLINTLHYHLAMGGCHMKKNIKKIIISLFIILSIFIICVENMVVVCEVIYTNDMKNEYEKFVTENGDLNYFLMRSQVVTEGTEYHVEDSTDIEQIDFNSKDVILYNWINPAFLRINNDFSLSGQVKYAVILSKDAIIEIKRKYNEDITCVRPKKVIMLTQNQKIFDSANDGRFYVRDLSVIGHIRFYFGVFLPFLRRSA